MGEKNIVKELNAFLKGRYMGIHAYEQYIGNMKDERIRKELQTIQKEHKQHATMVAERIQNLGGTPVDDVGFMGSIYETISNMKGTPDETHEMIKQLMKGEDEYGIKLSDEIVKGDLDQESSQLIQSIIDHDRQHVNVLRNLLH